MQKQSNRGSFILYNVLNKEVAFQEYFCNLLNIPSFLEIFINFISQKNNILTSKNIQFHNFHTEVLLGENNGRADLYLKLDNDEIFIFEIKNKRETTLTPNQPKSYLEHLNHRNENLFFLIPKFYHHEYNIYERWENFSEDKIKNQIFYWDDFTKLIKNEENEYIKAFYLFCENWFINSIQLKNDELSLLQIQGSTMELLSNTKLPSVMKKLENIVMNIGENLKGLKFKRADTGYLYSTKVNQYTIYFGIDYDAWEKTNHPINITIYLTDDYKNSFEIEKIQNEISILETKESDYFENTFGYIVNLDFSMDEEAYEDKLKDKLQYIINILK